MYHEADNETGNESLLERFRTLWLQQAAPPDVFAFLEEHASDVHESGTQIVLVDQYHRWQSASEIPVEDYFARCPFLSEAAQLELITEELGYLEEQNRFDAESFLDRFREQLSQHVFAKLEKEVSASSRTLCGHGEETDKPWPRPEKTPERTLAAGDTFGRYTIEGLLGRGSFGTVYRAKDSKLLRQVALKIPFTDQVTRAGGVDTFLNEARLVAQLDHPAIVPVFDVGQTSNGRCYVVSKLIDGDDLSQRLGQPLQSVEAAQLIATIAHAAHHAHRSGLIHRDIKPANILIDESEQPWLVDFGLAIRDEEFGTGSDFVGTPAWMSPEQARGEGHRVDARSDVYSLGVVLFEALTGRRPYRTGSTDELLAQIRMGDVRPPRQFRDTVPKALDRICLKALARRASERYSTALDFAEELEAFIAEYSGEDQASNIAYNAPPEAGGVSKEASGSSRCSTVQSSMSDTSVSVVPKGLRSFDAGDAEFFLELLPGPRDRFGLPDSLRFWLTRIQHREATNFSVGLLYGPSGCGKSSFVKAGLLPLLAGAVNSVYVEASAEGTASRLHDALQSRWPQQSSDRLPKFMAELRRTSEADGERALIVIDQFEQWLYSWNEDKPAELVAALRQCDGIHLQAIVMVRDDFWMAATRFFRDLEVPLVEHENSAAIDLFDKRHAKRVLRYFGVAFGILAADRGLSDSQKRLVDAAIDGIAEHDRISPVRLALFAEMLKGQEWSTENLRKMGGAEGVGLAFLDESFGPQAPVSRRTYSQAAERLLASLLPALGADIRGAAQTREDLRSAAEASSDGEFDALLQILDQQLRLITPTEAFDAESVESSPRYQLTHDYLVPSIRQWVQQRRSSSFAGRQFSLLIDRAEHWNQTGESRLLPSWWEDLGFRLFTRSRNWNEKQSRMMRQSGRRVLLMLTGLVAAVLLAVFAARDINGRYRARELQNRILNSSTSELPAILDEAETYRAWLARSLQLAQSSPAMRAVSGGEETSSSRRRRLHHRLALWRFSDTQPPGLHDSLLHVPAAEIGSVNKTLENHGRLDLSPLWNALLDQQAPGSQRLNSASVLARLSPADKRWSQVAEDVAEQLSAADTAEAGFWIAELRQVGDVLAEPLTRRHETELDPSRRRTQARALAAIFANDRKRLLELAIDSGTVEFAELAPALLELGPAVLHDLQAFENDIPADSELDVQAREKIARRAGNIAALRIRLGDAKAMELLAHAKDPTARSYLIHHYGSSGGRAGPLVDQLRTTANSGMRHGLLLALGEVPRDAWDAGHLKTFSQLAMEYFRDDPDSGVHGAAEWALRRLGLDGQIAAAVDEIKSEPVTPERKWSITPTGLTMIAVQGPYDLHLGTTEHDPERFYNETRAWRHCGRSFLIADREISCELYEQFVSETGAEIHHIRLPIESPDAPQAEVNWRNAAWFCNWLNEQEGIPKEEWVFLPNANGEYEDGMFMAEDSLQRTGYRMPTHYEWEWAARAGTTTSRYYGLGTDLLPEYAWFFSNAERMLHNRGQLKPNPWGLFDMLGNAYEWCIGRSSMVIELEPKRDTLRINFAPPRRVRGGNVIEPARYQRAARRSYYGAGVDGENIGLRVVRTLKVHDVRLPDNRDPAIKMMNDIYRAATKEQD